MPTLDMPRNDTLRLAFLRQALNTGKKDATTELHYVGQVTLDAVEAFLTQFAPAVTAADEKLGLRSKEVAEKDTALERLKTYVRDFYEVLKRRTYRRNDPASVLEFYGLPLDGTPPNPTTQEEWLALAEKIVAGDARAIAANYTLMTNPTAAEVQNMLTFVRREIDDVTGADRGYDQAQEAVAALRAQANQLITDVLDDLNYALRRKDVGSQRRIMRTYGVNYRYLPGEPVDEVAGAEPAPTQG